MKSIIILLLFFNCYIFIVNFLVVNLTTKIKFERNLKIGLLSSKIIIFFLKIHKQTKNKSDFGIYFPFMVNK